MEKAYNSVSRKNRVTDAEANLGDDNEKVGEDNTKASQAKSSQVSILQVLG
jgi:hypothetical protein